MNMILLQAIYLIVIFILGLFLIFTLKIGGSTLRQIVKSKMPGSKNKGAWFIQSDKGRKVKFIYKKIPNDLRIKIKSGSVPEEDQFAHINEIFHQTDGDGVPVLFTLEDLPFTFFLKKHHLEEFYPKVDEMIELIDEIVHKKMFKEAEVLKLTIKNTLSSMKLQLKYIPDSIKEIDAIFSIDKSQEYKDKHAIILLLKYKQHLLKLKESILENNNEMVDVHSLFETVGFVKNMTNFAFMEYQNGFLAAKQTQLAKKFNLFMMIMLIIIGVIVIIGIYMNIQTEKTMTVIQTTIYETSNHIAKINQSLGITVTNDTNQAQNINDPNIPVNRLG